MRKEKAKADVVEPARTSRGRKAAGENSDQMTALDKVVSERIRTLAFDCA